MKKLYALSLIAVLLIFAAVNAQHQHAAEKGQPAKMAACTLAEGEHHGDINVPTIQCGMCVKTVTGALKDVSGVTFVQVDLKAKKAHVHYSDKVKPADLKKAIAASGYDADDVKRDEKAHDALPGCCQSKR